VEPLRRPLVRPLLVVLVLALAWTVVTVRAPF
jgi:hypothetical protein